MAYANKAVKRLTKRKNDGSITIENATKIAEAFERLAAYEDTGLEPQEVESTLANYSAFLWHATNGRMSKTNYTVEAMRSEADNCIMEMCNDCEDRQRAERYEDAEAEGRLVVLPCKVGSKVWLTGWWNVCTWVSKLPSPIGRCIRYFSVESDGVYAHFKDGCVNVKYFGEIVFLTREEAEEALRKER